MRRRLIVVLAMATVLVAAVALPAQADHRKSAFGANLTTGAELHEVVGSEAHGTFRIKETRHGFAFRMQVKGLSGPVWGAHIHGLAGAEANAGILVSLCGAPGPTAVETCTTSDKGTLHVHGRISADLLADWGLSAGELATAMADGLTYLNVHTDLNPAGEVRGQIGSRR